MSLKCKNPIIIGGSGSSGSTLLATIINRHPDISIGPELSLFNKPALYNEPYHLFSKNLESYMVKGTSTRGWFLYWKTLRELKKYGWDKNELIKMSYKCKNNIEFIDNFFNRYLEENDSSIWAEKTPSNSYYFQSFLKLYPNGRIIHIYRDYRDVVSSLKKRGMNSYYASMLYLYNTSTALGCRKQENYYELSYEELVTDPSRTINDLCKFLKVPYDKKMIKESKGKNVNQIKSWRNNPSGEIKSNSIKVKNRILTNYDYFVFNHIRISTIYKKNFNLDIDSIKKVNDILGYDYRINRSKKIFKVFYMLKLSLSFIIDNFKRIIVMIYIDKTIYPLPGKIKLW